MPSGLDNVKHIVVLMMSCRSFDHMLGGLKKEFPKIDGLTGTESNPDANGNLVLVQPNADYRGQLVRDPDHHFPGVDLQIYGGAQGPDRVPNMQGFVKSYALKGMTNDASRAIMNYFQPDKIPVLTTLAREYAVFNRWFSSIPGPTICNRTFAHYGTSFGSVDMSMFTATSLPSVFERLRKGKYSSKLYCYDQQSSTINIANLANDQRLLSTFDHFIADCTSGNLPEYSFVEPNYSDHEGPGGAALLATDQHPDHNVLAGDNFIAQVYNAIRLNINLWQSTVLLIVYDTHGGLYDHVIPPACTPDGFVAPPAQTGTKFKFEFDRLGVRVPAVLVSPWIPRGTVIDSTIFEHASIPATVTSHFLGDFEQRTKREMQSNTFLNNLSNSMRPDDDCIVFKFASEGRDIRAVSSKVAKAGRATRTKRKPSSPISPPEAPAVPELTSGPTPYVARDRWTIDDSLGHNAYAYAIYRFLTVKDSKPPLAISIQAPWGGGKTSLMRMIQRNLDPDAYKKADEVEVSRQGIGKATVKQVLNQLKQIFDKSAQDSKQPTSPSADTGKSNSNLDIRKQTSIPPIEKEGERRVTVWFNAWKYESTAQVWAGLADCIVQQIGERLDPVDRELFWFQLQLRRFDATKIREKIFREVLASFFPKLIKWCLAYLAGIIALTIEAVKHEWPKAGGILIAGLVAIWGQFLKAKSEAEAKPARISLGELVQAPDYSVNLGFVHEVVEDLKRVFAAIPKKDLPMVIFIDDLDRCSPGKVAAVVEAINLFLAGEFSDCMFVLGIDDEMIAAALDKAHGDVIAKLPAYTKSSSIGWRFMDKFVQLPFVIPLPAQHDLTKYVNSLFSQDGFNSSVDPDVLDRAARVVEQGSTAEEVVERVVPQSLSPERKEALKKDVKIIQDMNEHIKRFTDQEESIRALISKHAKEYFNNPRDMKRFVNLFRFYYFLRAARLARGEAVVSLEQLCRWLVFFLKWPEVVRWLRRQSITDERESKSPFAILEHLAGRSKDFPAWQTTVSASLNLKLDETLWLSDRAFYGFFHREASDFKPAERLSSCLSEDTGVW